LEFPEYTELMLLNLLLMRFFVRLESVSNCKFVAFLSIVYATSHCCRAHAVYQTAHERLLEVVSNGAALDHEYVLYALQRSVGQNITGPHMGKVTLNEPSLSALFVWSR
jgi:hypothetical protein